MATPEDSTPVDILAHAATEASTPGANTDSQYECPFCVMMRKGGCEDVFKAFMECGEKADKGNLEMAECLPQFEALHLCMDKNKDVFDGLLQEMKEEEDRSKAAAGGTAAASSSAAEPQQQQTDSSAAVTAAATTHQQQAQPQQQEGSGASAAAAAHSSSSAVRQVQHSTSSAAAGGLAAAS